LVLEHVFDDAVGKAEQWAELNNSSASDALANVLSMLGIAGADRIAKAITNQASAAYITPSGPVLDLLSELAEEGDLATMSHLYGAFSVIHPKNAGFVLGSVPAKISSRYLARNRGIGIRQFSAYVERNPDWAENLKANLPHSGRFTQTVTAMADAIATGT
jgi:hypothetical protein